MVLTGRGCQCTMKSWQVLSWVRRKVFLVLLLLCSRIWAGTKLMIPSTTLPTMVIMRAAIFITKLAMTQQHTHNTSVIQQHILEFQHAHQIIWVKQCALTKPEPWLTDVEYLAVTSIVLTQPSQMTGINHIRCRNIEQILFVYNQLSRMWVSQTSIEADVIPINALPLTLSFTLMSIP